jgi:hypothetical protein
MWKFHNFLANYFLSLALPCMAIKVEQVIFQNKQILETVHHNFTSEKQVHKNPRVETPAVNFNLFFWTDLCGGI